MSNVRRFTVLLLTLLWVTGVWGDSPRAWLDRMVVANETFNYQGTLVHMCGGTMDIVEIVHRVNRGKVTERLTAQATGGRQIIRKADVVMCILPDQKKVMVEQRSAEVSPIGAQIDNFPSFSTIDPSLYDVAMMGVDRVADRETMIIAITLVDTFRYGYRLWLDRLTALPLKFELVDDAGQALEQGVFTEIEFHESLSEEDVAPTIVTDEFEWQHSAVVSNDGQIVDPRADPNALMQEPALSHWRVTVSPPGFELTFAQSTLAEGAPMPVEQLVYSDGLATISVFIEHKAEEADVAEGSSHIGATNAYTTISNDYLITAMGGVPIETVQMVALSVTAR